MSVLRITTDGDPFPAKAGHNGDGTPVNDGTQRTFQDDTVIQDQSDGFGNPVTYNISYKGGKGGKISNGVAIEDTANPHTVQADEQIGVAVNGVPLYCPFTETLSGYGNNELGSLSYAGYRWNLPNVNSIYWAADACGGKPEGITNEYRYRSGKFVKNGFDQNGEFTASSDYFTNGTTHSDGHSRIIGFALDGFPIYGPYGYSNALDNTSGISIMRSKYRLYDIEIDGPLVDGLPNRPSISGDGSWPLGTFKEDYIFNIGNSGTLDRFNGRFCVTPDFEDGTYAYFITFSDGVVGTAEPTVPAFPYIVGLATKEQRSR